MDRWISILSQGFRAQGVAAVALCPADRDPEASWLGRLAALNRECAATLCLDLPQPAALADFAAGAVRADIVRGGPRFAMIIDSDACCRRTLRYRRAGELPSPRADRVGCRSAQKGACQERHAQPLGAPSGARRPRAIDVLAPRSFVTFGVPSAP